MDRASGAKRWAARLFLLVVPDAALSDRLVSICRGALPGVHCVVCEDNVGAGFAVPPDGVDLVIVDARLAQSRSTAWLANLRRQIPRGRMLLLDGNSPGQLLALAVSLPVRLADRVTRLSIEGTS